MRTPILADGPARVLVAPDAYKGSLSARDAARVIADAIRAERPGAAIDVLPLADGGDGTIAALAAAGFAQRPVVTRGPTGVPTVARLARRDGVAVVELACACGIALLPPGQLSPMTSSSLGLGDAVAGALDDDPGQVVLGLGGSASSDGGTGLLVALGARILDASGAPVRPGGAGLDRIVRLDLDGLDPRLRGRRIVVASDVRSPLLGPDGAATAFGPQKGATAAEVEALERGLASWADVLAAATGTDVRAVAGAGAAGGCGAAALAALRAEPVSGAAFVHDALRLDDRIRAADLVVTGEGRLDRTSLLGKGLGEVARASAAAGVPVLAVCGQVALSPAESTGAGITRTTSLVEVVGAAAATTDPVGSLAAAVRHALDPGRPRQ